MSFLTITPVELQQRLKNNPNLVLLDVRTPKEYDEVHAAQTRLERQVRIVAGILVLLGVVLGFLVHKNFFFLSGFVGAGLVFA